MRREAETTLDTIDGVSDDIEASTSESIKIIDEDDDPTLTPDDYDMGYDGLDNTEINCHKCLRASFNFKKVNSICISCCNSLI